MKRPVQSGRRSLSFNMTPMIDVIFLLIIFFLCVNQYQKADSAEQVDLPVASSERVAVPEPTRHKPLVLNVLPSGQMLISGTAVPVEKLGRILDVAQNELPLAEGGQRVPLEVWVRADRKLPYSTVEPILQACAMHGIWKVAFKVTTPAQEAMGDGQ